MELTSSIIEVKVIGVRNIIAGLISVHNYNIIIHPTPVITEEAILIIGESLFRVNITFWIRYEKLFEFVKETSLMKYSKRKAFYGILQVSSSSPIFT